MPKIRFNPLIKQFYGRFGDLVFRRSSRDGEAIASRVADMTEVVWSEAQAAHRERFQLAVRYARRVATDEQARTVYEEAAERQGRVPFRLMLADAMHPPIVKKVDLSQFHGMQGDLIYIEACDDFRVVAVTITITDMNGTCLEQGDATCGVPDGEQWVYQMQSTIPPDAKACIMVTAQDRARGLGQWSGSTEK